MIIKTAQKVSKRLSLRCLLIVWLVIGLAAASCSQTASPVSLSTLEADATEAATPDPTSKPTRAAVTEPTSAMIEVTATLIEEGGSPEICSPLAGREIAELPVAVANPFAPPPPGSDDPHQGVDLADIDAQRMAIGGRSVQAVLSGYVAMQTPDRFPYGFALMVETPLDHLSLEWLESVNLPQPASLPLIGTSLICPWEDGEKTWDSSKQSVYVLYAHLDREAAFKMGEEVFCGQALGAVGQSGNALNPHLHLEARLGPVGARFKSMAHYDNSASLMEMANYCTWRVSGIFQVFDPFILFGMVTKKD